MANLIDAYVEELGHALRGPRRPRAELLTEARDSLDDAARAYEHAGLDTRSAERCAVADFGDVRIIAPAFQRELAIAQTRRTALLMLLVIGLQPLLWQAWWPWFSGEPSDAAPGAYAAVSEAIEWLGALTILAALLAVLALGVGTRYVDAARYGVQPRVVGIATLVLCAVFTVLGVALCVLSPDQTIVAGLLWLTPLLLVPLAVVTGAARRTLAWSAS